MRRLADEIAARPKPPLRLEWRRTWLDSRRDFACHTDGGDMIGRIYFSAGNKFKEPSWFWTVRGISGHAETQHEAARAVETIWFGGKH